MYVINIRNFILQQFQAGKRGLDTIHELAKQLIPDSNINSFFVSGASKVSNDLHLYT